MEHSESYEVAPPAGPAGENLFLTSGTGTPEQATKAWYDEVADCSWPGCSSSTNGNAVGHFTALIWDGVKSIGCALNEHGLGFCRYKAQDYKGCFTPNMGGGYETNVYQAGSRTETECKALAEACAAGATEGTADTSGDGATVAGAPQMGMVLAVTAVLAAVA